VNALGGLFLAVCFILGMLVPAGGVVGGVWLAILGEWSSVGVGLVSALAGASVISLGLMPGLAFAAGAGSERPRVAVASGLLAGVWATAAITAWCTLVVTVLLSKADSAAIFPHVILAYSAAAAPIAVLSEKEEHRGNQYASIITLFLLAGILVGVLVAGFGNKRWPSVAIPVAVCAGVGYAVAGVFAWRIDRSRRRFL
jgi:hypothetical protein